MLVSRIVFLHSLIAACAISLTVAGSVFAADINAKAAGKERELARRVQQLQQEKGDLTGKLKELSDKGQELGQTAERAKSDIARVSRELAAAKKTNTALKDEMATKVAAHETEIKDLKRQIDEAVRLTARREGEKRKIEEVVDLQVQTMGRQGALIAACRTDNARLYEYSVDLLQRLKGDGKLTVSSLLGIGAVDSFNVYQEYRDKLDKLQIAPPAVSP